MSTWRTQFPFFASNPKVAFLDSAASAQKPAAVLDAMSNFARAQYANTHRGVHSLAEASTAAFENSRAAVATFIGAPDPTSVIFTAGTTASANLAATSLARSSFIPKGSAIVATALEHHSNFLPWQRLAADISGKFIVAPISSRGDLDLVALEKIFKENKVSLLALTHASNVIGAVPPVPEVSAIAHRHGALVFIDGAQAVAHMPINVTELGCDFYAFSGHKLYGPTGIGVLYISPKIISQLPPSQLGGGMVHKVGATFANTTWAPAPYRFEAGTPPIIEAIGLHSAIKFISEIGFDKISTHEQALKKELLERLAKIPDIKIYGTPQNQIGVISFNLGDLHPHDVGSILATQGVAVRVGHHCAQPLMSSLGIAGCVRASIGLYNDSSDIEALIKALNLAHKKLS